MKKLIVNTTKIYIIPDGCKIVRKEDVALLQTETGELISFGTIPSKTHIHDSSPVIGGKHLSFEDLNEFEVESWDHREIGMDENLKIVKPSKEALSIYNLNRKFNARL